MNEPHARLRNVGIGESPSLLRNAEVSLRNPEAAEPGHAGTENEAHGRLGIARAGHQDRSKAPETGRQEHGKAADLTKPDRARPFDPQADLRRRYVATLKAAAERMAAAIEKGWPESLQERAGRFDWAPFADLRCGAKTRAGTPCKRRDLYRSGRCPMHGGLSTGPRTVEGKARSRWNAKRTP